MAEYSAIVENTAYPLGYIKFISGKRIDAINRAIVATGKAWQGLELPKRIKRGHYFAASYDGWMIRIYKES